MTTLRRSARRRRGDDGVARGIGDQRVAAFERALGVVAVDSPRERVDATAVGGERRGRAGVDRPCRGDQLAASGGVGGGERAALARDDERMGAGELNALSDPAVGRGADLAQQLVQAGALVAQRARRRSRAGREAMGAAGNGRGRGARGQARGGAHMRAGGVDVELHERLGGVGRGRAGDGGDVVDQRAVDLVADGADDRKAQVRDRAAEVLVAEGPEVGERAAAATDDRDLDLRLLGEAAQSAGDRGRGAAILHRCVGPDDRPAPAAALEPGEQVGAGGALAGGDDADRLRQRRAGESGLGFEQALGLKLSPRGVELGKQVALAGEPDVGGAKGEARRGGLRAGVVVGPAARSRPRRRP